MACKCYRVLELPLDDVKDDNVLKSLEISPTHLVVDSKYKQRHSETFMNDFM